MKSSQLIGTFILYLTSIACSGQSSRTLNIYWIDVEGGAATLIVTPGGESVLMDAGWNTEDDRDAKRIVKAMGDAKITKLDYVIASHYHDDHVSGMPALARLVSIGQFIDHGESMEQDRPGPWKNYLKAAEGKRHTVKPGDTLPLKGISFTFVTSNREVVNSPTANSDSNKFCEGALSEVSPGEAAGENASSVGYLLSLGNFEFVNLGDLTLNIQHKLACPSNRIGVIDLYQVPHHGNGVATQLANALAPTVAVLNNGARKGGSPEAFEAISGVPEIKGIWQLHRATKTDDKHNTSEKMTANLTEENDAGHWIKATVQADGGSYTIVNGRNGYSETYKTK